jgi:hypothetical protein
MLRSLIALPALLLLPAGCIGGVLPPSRTDIGETVIADGGRVASGLRVTTGAHVASASLRRDTRFDIGAGYVYERVGAELPPASGAVQSAPGGAGAAGPTMDEGLDGVAEAHGGYFDVSHTFARGRSHRSWLGARGEVLARETPDGTRPAAGVYARAAWELFTLGEGVGGSAEGCTVSGGYARGTAGLGLYVESGAQWTADQETAFVATAGLTVRLPLLAGFAVSICPHC